jgi:hypothetical protein
MDKEEGLDIVLSPIQLAAVLENETIEETRRLSDLTAQKC